MEIPFVVFKDSIEHSWLKNSDDETFMKAHKIAVENGFIREYNQKLFDDLLDGKIALITGKLTSSCLS